MVSEDQIVKMLPISVGMSHPLLLLQRNPNVPMSIPNAVIKVFHSKFVVKLMEKKLIYHNNAKEQYCQFGYHPEQKSISVAYNLEESIVVADLQLPSMILKNV